MNFGIGAFGAAAADFERSRLVAAALGDRPVEGMALAYRGMAEFFHHEFATAEQTLRALLAMDDSGYDQGRTLAALLLGLLFLALGRRSEAEPLLAVVERDTARLDAVGQGLWSWLNGRLEAFAGRFDESLRKLAEGRPAAERSMANLLWHQWIEAMSLAGRGDYERALSLLEQTLATCDRVGDLIIRMRIPNTVGWIYSELCDHQRALEWNQRGLTAIRASGAPLAEVETQTLLNVGENFLALGLFGEAEKAFFEVEEVVRHPKPNQLWVHWRFSERFFHSYGEFRLARGDLPGALGLADECVELASHNGSMKVIVKGRRLRAQALTAQGRLDLAEQELDSALEMAQQVRNPPQLWKAYLALGDLRAAQGRHDEATQAYHAALAVIDEVAAALTDESRRATFLRSDHVERIRQAASEIPG